MIGGKKNKKRGSVVPSTDALDETKVDPYKRLFHEPLAVAAQRSDKIWGAVPSPIRKSINWLNLRGLQEEGLYRVPGNLATFKTYKMLFDSGSEFEYDELKERSCENVAMVITKYLQDLPEPLYTTQYEEHFRVALRIRDEKEKLSVLKSVICLLPYENRETIRVIAHHLRQIVLNSDVNMMTVRNIELTWTLSVGQLTGALFGSLVQEEDSVPSTIQFFISLESNFQSIYISKDNPSLYNNTLPLVVLYIEKYFKDLTESSTPYTITSYNFLDFSDKDLKPIIHRLNCGENPFENVAFDGISPNLVICVLTYWISCLPEPGLLNLELLGEFESCGEYIDREIKNGVVFTCIPSKLDALVWSLNDVYFRTIRAVCGIYYRYCIKPGNFTAEKIGMDVFGQSFLSIGQIFVLILKFYEDLFEASDADLDRLKSFVMCGNGGFIPESTKFDQLACDQSNDFSSILATTSDKVSEDLTISKKDSISIPPEMPYVAGDGPMINSNIEELIDSLQKTENATGSASPDISDKNFNQRKMRKKNKGEHSSTPPDVKKKKKKHNSSVSQKRSMTELSTLNNNNNNSENICENKVRGIDKGKHGHQLRVIIHNEELEIAKNLSKTKLIDPEKTKLVNSSHLDKNLGEKTIPPSGDTVSESNESNIGKLNETDEILEGPPTHKDNETDSPLIHMDKETDSPLIHKDKRVDGPAIHKDKKTDSSGIHKDKKTDSPGIHKDKKTDSPGIHKDKRVDGPAIHKDKKTDSPGIHKDKRVDGPVIYRDKKTDSPGIHKDKKTDSPGIHKDKRVDSPVIYRDKKTDSPGIHRDKKTDSPGIHKDKRVDSPVIYRDKKTDSPGIYRDKKTDSPGIHRDKKTDSPGIHRDKKTDSPLIHKNKWVDSSPTHKDKKTESKNHKYKGDTENDLKSKKSSIKHNSENTISENVDLEKIAASISL